ncbi:hypothetical protein B0H13DRAFT_2373124 [Mycena leptocephala]|nr:hypothetical protein B0H13DRAFT_2373124 [Mycena leptocephala]
MVAVGCMQCLPPSTVPSQATVGRPPRPSISAPETPHIGALVLSAGAPDVHAIIGRHPCAKGTAPIDAKSSHRALGLRFRTHPRVSHPGSHRPCASSGRDRAMDGALRGSPRTLRRGGRGNRPRPDVCLPARLAMKPPPAPLCSRARQRGSPAAVAASDVCASTSAAPHDHGMLVRTISAYPRFVAEGGYEQDALLYPSLVPKTGSRAAQE